MLKNVSACPLQGDFQERPPMMPRKEDHDLPEIVREIKEETEALIGLFDRGFLRTCGIASDEEITETPGLDGLPLISALRRIARRA
jgi:hypothetical protein